MFAMLGASLMLASCSEDGPEAPTAYYRVIDFENTRVTLAGPTSYGANLYASYDGTKFVKGEIEVEKGVNMEFGINRSSWYNDYDFSAGGMVLSQWNYRTDIEGVSEGWWYTFSNQCSVYNTDSQDGANKGAGAGGSNTFAVINGFEGEYSDGVGSFRFTNGAEYRVVAMDICPTSYVYGCITEGNAFGNNPDKSLEEVGGWFKIIATGYDAEGNETASVEKYICDYRSSIRPVKISSTWENWDLSGLGRVNEVKFNFEGSDSGAYGLNTPAYMALDNITIRMN